MRDRSLVAFSLLSQMSVGAFLVLGVLHFWVIRQAGVAAAEALTQAPLLVVDLLMISGLVASFFHLGAPGRAWRTVANLRSSWLSREVLFALLFTGATVLLGAMQWFDFGISVLRSMVGGVAALLGLLLIVSMAKAYRLRTIPAWDTWATPATFLITALLLGGLGDGAVLGLVSSSGHEMRPAVQQWIALAAIVLLCMQLLVTLLWFMGISATPGAALQAATRISRVHGTIFRMRLALMVAAVAVAGAALAPWVEEVTADVAIALAFGLVLAAEVLGRMLFYEARVRHGV